MLLSEQDKIRHNSYTMYNNFSEPICLIPSHPPSKEFIDFAQ